MGKKHKKEKFKVRKSTLKYKVLIPEDPNMNREKLVKAESEYFDVSESEEESSEEKDEDRSLVKRKDKRDDDDDDSKQILSSNNIRIIKNALKIDSSSSSKPEQNPSNSTPNNSNNAEILSRKLIPLKTLVLPLILMSSMLAL
jgi:hypothetical protein